MPDGSKDFMIIQEVNIYPQETEDLLIAHPKVADAAVLECRMLIWREVAVIQTVDGVAGDDALSDELLTYLGEHLSRQKSRGRLITRMNFQDYRLVNFISVY